MRNKGHFAVFDIDGTVIRWQLYHSIVSELGRRGLLVQGAAERISDARMTWKRRAHQDSFKHYEDVLVEVYYESLQRISVSEFNGATQKVFEEYKDQVYTYTRNLITQLKEQDYTLFAISGSHHEIVEKFAQYYGFHDWIGSKQDSRDNHFTGEYTTPIRNKGEVLKQLVDKHELTYDHSIAVGDSESDIAMLSLVHRPIAFNPSRGLLATARENQWDIVLERKNVAYVLRSMDGTYIVDFQGVD